MPEMIGGIIDDPPAPPRGTAESIRVDRAARLERIRAAAAERRAEGRVATPVKARTHRGVAVRGAPVDRLAMQLENPRPIAPRPTKEAAPVMASNNGAGDYPALKARINGETPARKPLEERLAERFDAAQEPEPETPGRGPGITFGAATEPPREPKRRGPKPGFKRTPKPEGSVGIIREKTAEKRPESTAKAWNNIPADAQVFERLRDELTAAAEVVAILGTLPIQSARNVLRLVLDRLGGDPDAAY